MPTLPPEPYRYSKAGDAMTAINTHSASIYRYSGLMAVGELVRFLAAKNKASNKHLPYMCHPQGICATITIRQL